MRTGKWAAMLVAATLSTEIWRADPSAAAAWTRVDTLNAVRSNDQFGSSLCGTGDFDGDGVTGDIAVGAHFHDVGAFSAAGAVYLFPAGWPPGSPASLELDGRSSDEHFGESLAGAQDVDGDGHPDLAVGAPLRAAGANSAAGAVDVFRGGPPLSTLPWATLSGEAADDWFGQSVALGDVDGDGRADIIVGAPFNDRHGSAAGAVFIYRGGSVPPTTPWRVLVGENINDQFGWSVAYAGDVNGDGFGDIIVGARLHGSIGKLSAGKAYLFYGGAAMDTLPDRSWVGELANDWFGHAVAGPGDVDGGGRPDILVGAPFNDRAGSAAGAAYLFRGEDPSGSPPAVVWTGESANAQLGWALSGAGDLNGDGRPDVLAGARFQDSGAISAAGRLYAFLGGTPLATVPFASEDGETSGAWLGAAVAAGPNFFVPGRSAALAGAPLDAFGTTTGRARISGMLPSTGVSAPPRTSAGWTAWPVPARTSVQLADGSGGFRGGFRCEIRDVAGRMVRELAAAGVSSAATPATWDLEDSRGRRVPPGLYLVSVRASDGPGSAREAPIRVIVTR